MSISRVYRLLRMITLLQGRRPLAPQDLADELEVSRRTVFRDLNMLEMARIPYYFDPEAGGYRINRHFFLPPVNLTLPEALALLVLTGRMRSGGKLPLFRQGARAALKIESILPNEIRHHVGSVIDKLSMSMGPVSDAAETDETFEALVEAVGNRHVCRLEYDSLFEKRVIATSVRPLRLVFLSRAWYLIAYSAKHRENRTFKLSRIRKLTVTSRIFEESGEFDLEEYFGRAWSMIPEGRIHDVHLHFEPLVARNVAEVGWHATQSVEWNDDGSAEFHVTVDGLREITWWILGYGKEVEVVSPPALRQAVADVARQVLRKYDKDGR